MNEALYARAAELAGRPVEVEQLLDGGYIVLWLCFEKSPPPMGATEEEALTGFIAYMEAQTPVDLPSVES